MINKAGELLAEEVPQGLKVVADETKSTGEA